MTAELHIRLGLGGRVSTGQGAGLVTGLSRAQLHRAELLEQNIQRTEKTETRLYTLFIQIIIINNNKCHIGGQ